MIAEADNAAHDSVVEAEAAESTTMTAAADAHSDPNLQAASPQVPAGCLNRGVVTHKTPPDLDPGPDLEPPRPYLVPS